MRNHERQTIALSILITGLSWFLSSIVHYAWCDGDQWAMFGHDAQHTGRSTTVGPQTGGMKWKVFPSVDGRKHSISSPVLGPDGTVYVGSNENYVFAYAPDGTLKWRFLTGGDVVGQRISVASDGTVYVTSDDAKLYVLKPDGSEKYQSKYFGSGAYVTAPTIAPNGTLYVVANDKLYALNPDLSETWMYPNSRGYHFTNLPAIGPDGTIFVGNEDNNLYAINPDNSVKWTYLTGGDVNSSAVVAQDGTIYVGSADNKVHAINPNGTPQWREPFVTGGDVNATPALGLDGNIYVGSEDSLFYAINPDGTRKWPTPFDTPGTSFVQMTTAAVGGDGTVYFGSEQTIYAVTPSGDKLWDFPGDGTVTDPAIGQDGTIYFGTDYWDGMLYAIGPGPGPGKPDLLIKTSNQPDSSYALDDVYQSEASGDQIETSTATFSSTAVYQVRVQNDNNATNSYVVRAVDSDEVGWAVAYRAGSTVITDFVHSTAGYRTSVLIPGASEIITVEMAPEPAVTVGTTKSSIVLVHLNETDTTVRDAVKAVSTMANPAPTVTSITPNSGLNTGSVNFTNLAGTGFKTGASVKLTKSGQSDIAGTSLTVVGSTQITCTVNLTSAATGQWNVFVINPDGQGGMLPNGFTINAPSPTHDVALTSLTASPNPASKGQNVTVTYTVKNNGTATESNLTFKLSYGSTPLGTTQTVGTLTAGQQTTKTMTVKVPKRQRSGDYLITGTVSTVSGESNTSDNSATVKVTVR